MDRARVTGWVRRAADAIADVAGAAVTSVAGGRVHGDADKGGRDENMGGGVYADAQRNSASCEAFAGDTGSRLEREWRQYLRQYNQPVMRSMVADTIPDIVCTMWREEFLELPYMAGDESSGAPQPASTAEPAPAAAPPAAGSAQSAGSDHGTPASSTASTGVARLTLASPASPRPGAGTKRPHNDPLDDQAASLTRRFVHEVLRRTHVSTAAMLLALFFVHRYRTLPRAEVGNAGSQFRMFLVGMLLAHKYSEDHPYTNKVWAQLSEVPVACVNDMEREFLRRIDHRLSVRLGDFQRWVVGLDRRFGWTLTSAVRGRDYRAMPLPPPPLASSAATRVSNTAASATNTAAGASERQISKAPGAEREDDRRSAGASRRFSNPFGPS